jgi:hypothetical protein
LRATLRELLPEAEEALSYGLPAFVVGGKPVAGYAWAKRHCSYYPHSGAVLSELADELDGIRLEQGHAAVPVRRAPTASADGTTGRGQVGAPAIVRLSGNAARRAQWRRPAREPSAGRLRTRHRPLSNIAIPAVAARIGQFFSPSVHSAFLCSAERFVPSRAAIY